MSRERHLLDFRDECNESCENTHAYLQNLAFQTMVRGDLGGSVGEGPRREHVGRGVHQVSAKAHPRRDRLRCVKSSRFLGEAIEMSRPPSKQRGVRKQSSAVQRKEPLHRRKMKAEVAKSPHQLQHESDV